MGHRSPVQIVFLVCVCVCPIHSWTTPSRPTFDRLNRSRLWNTLRDFSIREGRDTSMLRSTSQCLVCYKGHLASYSLDAVVSFVSHFIVEASTKGDLDRNRL